MPYLVLAQVKLPYPSGLPRDVAVNTFTFSTEETPADPFPDLTPYHAFLGTFYNEVGPGSGTNICSMISEYVVRGNVEVEYFLVDDEVASPPHYIPSPGGPVPLVIGAAAGTTPFPLEVACVLSIGGSTTPR